MPIVPFESLPDEARCWVFGARAPLDEIDAPRLMAPVDRYLKQWKAHGVPLTVGRIFRDEFFLVVAVDETNTDASGCSFDGLFRILVQAEEGIGTSMVGGGNVYFRDELDLVHCIPLPDFEFLASTGEVSADTTVFDTTVTTLGAYRERFERPARESWHAQLFKKP
jgi:hypothetical protein